MEFKEYVKERLEKSAEESKQFWAGVKSRISNEFLDNDGKFQIIDIQEISDDCLDLILLRKNDEATFDQLEHCRIVAERRWFKKPKIKTYFSSGPFADEFFNEK